MELCRLRVKLPPATASLITQPPATTVEAIPLSALPEGTTSELASLSSKFQTFLFNVERQAGKQ